MANPRQDRLYSPLMHAFRTAFKKKDSKVRLDLREDGERVIAQRRLAARAPISEGELRELVKGDVDSLLNTTNLDAAEDLSEVPNVRKSILNFGFPDLVKRTLEDRSLSDIAREVEVVLSDYEPRLKRGSIRARRDASIAADKMRARFIVSAELRMHPVNLQVEFVAEVEYDSGRIEIDRV